MPLSETPVTNFDFLMPSSERRMDADTPVLTIKTKLAPEDSTPQGRKDSRLSGSVVRKVS